ncbi:MAG: hypothetical protein IKP27_06850 [Paludibacteraceae bacterium]|nr:hypothetical protein [Paludibacteraceae bacterium]
MDKLFLKMKHWQLFLLLYLPIIVDLIWMLKFQYSFLSKIKDLNGPVNPAEIAPSSSYTSHFSFIFYIVWACYLLTLLHALNDRVPTQLKINLKIPRLSIILPFAYLCLSGIISLFVNGLEPLDLNTMESVSGKWIIFATLISLISIPFNLFLILCGLYSLYIVVKLLVTAEKQRESKFDDIIAELVLLFIYPIGVWIIQPRINKLFEQENLESQVEKQSEQQTDRG